MWSISPAFSKVGGPPPAAGITWDPTRKGTYGVLSNGNLTFAGEAAAGSGVQASTGVGKNSGKYYYEVVLTTLVGEYVGLYLTTASPGGIDPNSFLGYSTETIGRNCASTRIRSNGNKGTAALSAFASGDILGCLTDFTTNTITFTKNNAADCSWTGFPAGLWAPAIYNAASASAINTARFSPADWSYTPPEGYEAW